MLAFIIGLVLGGGIVYAWAVMSEPEPLDFLLENEKLRRELNYARSELKRLRNDDNLNPYLVEEK